MSDEMNYRVRYSVTTTLQKHGEYDGAQKVAVYTMMSVSNDLNEIFTDLFDQHRNESIIGLEILSVVSVHMLIPQLEYAI